MARIDGLDELVDVYNDLPEVLEVRAAGQALLAGAQLIANGAAARAPRRTGELAASMVVAIELDSLGWKATIGPAQEAFYGIFLEFGTPKMAARPFLRPALDEDGPRAMQLMAERYAVALEAQARILGGR